MRIEPSRWPSINNGSEMILIVAMTVNILAVLTLEALFVKIETRVNVTTDTIDRKLPSQLVIIDTFIISRINTFKLSISVVSHFSGCIEDL